MPRTILYIESDDHGGNIRGLMSPDTKLPDDNYLNDLIAEMANDGRDATYIKAEIDTIIQNPNDYDEYYYSPALRRYQKFLWALREQNLTKLIDLAQGDPIVYLHLGDITQGNKYASDWVTTRIGDQFLIALANHRPIMQLPNLKLAAYIEGTSSHVFGDGTSGGVVSGQLRAEFPSIEIMTCAHGLIDLDGFVIDAAHHGPGPGSRKWLEGNISSYYLRDRMIKELLRQNAPADLYLRAHFHTWALVFWNIAIDDTDHKSWLALLPSMCGLNAYGRQATKSVDRVTNGALCLELIDNKILDFHRWTKTLDVKNRKVMQYG